MSGATRLGAHGRPVPRSYPKPAGRAVCLDTGSELGSLFLGSPNPSVFNQPRNSRPLPVPCARSQGRCPTKLSFLEYYQACNECGFALRTRNASYLSPDRLGLSSGEGAAPATHLVAFGGNGRKNVRFRRAAPPCRVGFYPASQPLTTGWRSSPAGV